MTKPEVITEEPPLPQPPETEPVPPAWEETPVQTEAVQENPESNAQPETCIVPETERDLPRMAHKVIGEVFDTYIILEYDAQTLMLLTSMPRMSDCCTKSSNGAKKLLWRRRCLCP